MKRSAMDRLQQAQQLQQLQQLLKRDDQAFENLAKMYPETDKFRAFVSSDEVFQDDVWYEVDFKRLVADTTSIWQDSIRGLIVIPTDALESYESDEVARQALRNADVDDGLIPLLKSAVEIPEDKYQLLLVHCHYVDVNECLGNEMCDLPTNCDLEYHNNYHHCWLKQIACYQRHLSILKLLCQRFPESVCGYINNHDNNNDNNGNDE